MLLRSLARMSVFCVVFLLASAAALNPYPDGHPPDQLLFGEYGVALVRAQEVYMSHGAWTHVFGVQPLCPDRKFGPLLEKLATQAQDFTTSILQMNDQNQSDIAILDNLVGDLSNIHGQINYTRDAHTQLLAQLDGIFKLLPGSTCNLTTEEITLGNTTKENVTEAGEGKVRVRRGFLGIASSSEVDQVDERVTQLYSITSKINKRIQAVAEQSLSLTSQLRKDVSTEITAVTQYISKMCSALETTIQSSATWSYNATKRLEHIVYLQGAVSGIAHAIESYHMKVGELRYFYQEFRSLLQTKTLNLEIIPVSELLDTVAYVEANLPPNRELVPVRSALDYYSTPLVEISGDSSTFFITLRLQVIPRDPHYRVYTIKSVPVNMGNSWVQVRDLPHAIIISSMPRLMWLAMSEAEYLYCIQQPLRTCKTGALWTEGSVESCAAALLDYPVPAPTGCVFGPTVDQSLRRGPGMYGLSLPQNRWLLSVNHSVVVSRNCHGVDTTPLAIKNVTLIQLAGPCSIIHPYIFLVPFNDQLNRTTSQIAWFNPLYTLISGFAPTPWNESLSPPPKWESQLPSDKDIKLLLEQSQKGLSNMIESHDITMSLDQEMLEHEINKFGTARSTGWDPVFGGLSFTTWCVIIIFIGLLLKCLPMLKTLIRRAPILTPMAGSIPMTHAAALNVTPTQNSTLVSMWFPEWGLDHTHLTAHIIMWLISLCVMIIFFYCHYACLQRVKHRLLAATNQLPKNMSLVHHEGEPALILWFTMVVKARWGHDVIITEVGVQACTIVGFAADWYCTIGQVAEFLPSEVKFSPRQTHVEIPVHWGPHILCMKNRRYPAMETCSEMPSKLRVKVISLINQGHDYYPWSWKEATISRLTRVEVKGRDNIPLYSVYESISL